MKQEIKQKSITLGELKKLKIPVSVKMLQDKINKGERDLNGKVLLEGKAIVKGIETSLKLESWKKELVN
jgi:hypothetical protein